MLFDIKIPRDIENIITYNLLFLFVIAFYHMTYYDNVSKIECINPYLGISVKDNVSTSSKTEVLDPLQKLQVNISGYAQDVDHAIYKNFKEQLQIKNDFIKLADFYIFFLVIPILNIIYGVWCYKNGLLRWTKKYNLSQ